MGKKVIGGAPAAAPVGLLRRKFADHLSSHGLSFAKRRLSNSDSSILSSLVYSSSLTNHTAMTMPEPHPSLCPKADAFPIPPPRAAKAAEPPRGGLIFDSEEDRLLAERQRASIRFVFGRISSQILSGTVSLKGMSMPVHLNEPRSFLQRLTDQFVYAQHFLPAAAAANGDPVQRLNLVAAFVVSALHRSSTMAKVFNPHIGETYQASFGPASAPTQIALEQTRHHPPVSHYYARAPDGSYALSGYASFDSQVRFAEQSLVTRRTGLTVIDFADDGSRIAFTQPPVVVRGLLGGERRVEVMGTCSIYYERYNLVMDLLFDPPQAFFMFGTRQPSDRVQGVVFELDDSSSVNFSGAFAKEPAACFGRPDDVLAASAVAGHSTADGDHPHQADGAEGTLPVELRADKDVQASVLSAWQAGGGGSRAAHGVYEGPAEEVSTVLPGMSRRIVALVSGSFVSHLNVGGLRYWDLETPDCEVVPMPLDVALPSDSRHRADLKALLRALDADIDSDDPESPTRDELLDESQREKEAMEMVVRAEARKRPVAEHVSDPFLPKSVQGISTR